MSSNKTTSQSLELDKRHLGLIIDAAPIGIVMADEEGVIMLVNKQVEHLFGYSRGELLGRSIDILIPDTKRKDRSEFLNQFLAEPGAKSLRHGRDLQGLHKDGTRLPLDIGLNSLNADGKQFVLASLVDITERKSSEERIRLVVEASPSGMIMVDRNGKMLLVNSQTEKLFGYTRDELMGMPMETLFPKSSQEAALDCEQNYFAEPQVVPGTGRDLYGQRKDGSILPVEVVLNSLESGGETFVLVSVVDNTERKHAQDLLQEKVIELERSNAELQQFAYVCSHDMQEPLRVITNYTQLIASRYGPSLDANGLEFIAFTVDAAKRMQQLISDLLMYSRVNTKGQSLNETSCSNVVDIALANLSVAIKESETQLLIGEMPTISGDRSQLVQLFQNLIGNAIKFRSAAPPAISISAEQHDSWWQFAIRDNGLGFDMKHAERVFVIFQRLHNKEMYPGSGIGLAISKKIVERHGGHIWAESEPEKGTCFYFTLPALTAQELNHVKPD